MCNFSVAEPLFACDFSRLRHALPVIAAPEEEIEDVLRVGR